FPHGSADFGSRFAIFSATGFRADGEILFAVKPFAAGRLMVRPPLQVGPATVVKSPLRTAAVGTYAIDCRGAEGCGIRWNPAKKNSLLRNRGRTGPPIVPPY